MANIKRELETAWSADLATALETEARLQGEAFASEDLRQGVAAYQQRRRRG
jgi:enoyl-CoA hydratase/carnithine racemase